MEKIIKNSEKCIVKENQNKISKTYLDEESFKNECDVYKKLKDSDFMTKVIQIDENELTITMEKIIEKNFFDYVLQNNKIPLNFLKELEKIRIAFLEKGFYDYGDFFKPEHIFISETNVEGYCKIKVIDFDKVSKIKDIEIYEILKQKIKDDFNLLNTEREKFEDQFSINNNTAITDFFKNKN